MGSRNSFSPLRYPGGKASIANFFVEMLKKYGISSHGTYCEPFAGGAGVALALLLNKHIENIVINDFDPHIASFWQSILSMPDDFIECIENTPISIKEWKIQRNIYDNIQQFNLKNKKDLLLVGFSTFFLNRCNRSGILPKAGPIGGYLQNGNYTLDARFKKGSLIEKIKTIASNHEHIKFVSMDAIDFLKTLPFLTSTPQDTFLYLDPPYFHNGSKLYLNFYTTEDHIALADHINNFDFCPWLMTYDNCSEIKDIYKNFSGIIIEEFPIQYTMQKVRIASELLIHKKHTMGDEK